MTDPTTAGAGVHGGYVSPFASGVSAPVPAPTCSSCEQAPGTVLEEGHAVCGACAMKHYYVLQVGRWSTWVEREPELGDIA